MTDLVDGLESLQYWRGRRERLAWYRVSARREAKVMATRWEQRVRAALLTERGVSVGTRAAAAVLLGRIWLGRVSIRKVGFALAAVTTVFVVLPLAAFVVLLAQLF